RPAPDHHPRFAPIRQCQHLRSSHHRRLPTRLPRHPRPGPPRRRTPPPRLAERPRPHPPLRRLRPQHHPALQHHQHHHQRHQHRRPLRKPQPQRPRRLCHIPRDRSLWPVHQRRRIRRFRLGNHQQLVRHHLRTLRRSPLLQHV